MDQNTLVLKHYYSAIYSNQGSSDSDYAWPPPLTPLHERIQDLHLILRKLRCLGEREPDPCNAYQRIERLRTRPKDGTEPKAPRSLEEYLEEDVFQSIGGALGAKRLARLWCQYVKRGQGKTRSVLLTHRWLEEGSRIWRRATTGDGKNRTFMNDVLHAVSRSSYIQQEVERSAREEEEEAARWGCSPSPGNFSVEGLKCSVMGGFLFQGDEGFLIELDTGNSPVASPQREDDRHKYWAAQIVLQVAESYGEQAGGSRDPWKRELYLARNEIRYLFCAPKLIICDANYVRFLHFRTESELWNQVCQLRPA